MAKSITLQCRECKKEYTPEFRYVCDECFGPLDVQYPEIRIERDNFANREQTYWRYHELLPILDKSNIVSINAGMTPLVHAKKLGAKLGLDNLYIKNDSVNPTFSFKDRPAGVAVSKSGGIWTLVGGMCINWKSCICYGRTRSQSWTAMSHICTS